jgi:hypothetical protein
VGVALRDYQDIIDTFKECRKNEEIHRHTSITFSEDLKEISIWSDDGRTIRPVFVVKNGKLPFNRDELIESIEKQGKDWNWSSLLEKGWIEYLDTSESTQDNVKIAIFPWKIDSTYTHCEIHPTLVFGVGASIIPFCDHNQAPRNTYQAAMCKQAVGVYVTNYRSRMDTLGLILHHPQRPMVYTKAMDFIHYNDLPAGENLIVAIMCFSGYNQEDSIIVNRSAIDRGLLRCTIYRTEKEEEKKGNLMDDERFEIPGRNSTFKMRNQGAYKKLDTDGLVAPGTRVVENDIVIGKTTPYRDDANPKYTRQDSSVSLRKNETGIIDDVLYTVNEDGYNFVKVRIRSEKTPQIGDKLACLTDDHEVLTENGWKPVSDVKVGDVIATINPETHYLEYHPVNKTFAYQHTGEMYSIKAQQIDLVTTLNHRMYVKKRGKDCFELIQAQVIHGKRVRYKKDAINPNPDYNLKIDGFEIADTHAFLELFGWWIAEGWLEKTLRSRSDRNTSFYEYRLTISQVKVHGRTRMFHLAKKLGLNMYSDKKQTKLYISNIHICKYFESIGVCVKAIEKFLPDFVWKLSLEQCRSLLNGMMGGDGSVCNSESWTYYTSSVKLANDVQRLCLHSGWSANVKLRSVKGTPICIRGKNMTTNADSWAVQIVKSKNTPQVNTKTQNIQEEKIIQFCGNVYCVEVPNHIFYVRRNGKPVWTGNSRHGQKGTIGMIYPEANMPYTTEGIRPDIIINPHCVPSRMTVGHLLECLLGQSCAMEGEFGDGTPFTHDSPEEIGNKLHRAGYNRHGKHQMFHPHTGKPIEALIYLGPTFYERLKHMVDDKLHARSRGPIQSLTRQPVEGRSRDGGLRFGEMERDAMISHGASDVLRERLFYQSDHFTVFMCPQCGLFAQCKRRDRFICNACNNMDLVKVEIPYACKLFFQELLSMGITPRMIVENYEDKFQYH